MKARRDFYMTKSGRTFLAKQLVRLNRSYALVLPKAWVKLIAKGEWVEIQTQSQEIRIRPLDDEQLEAVTNDP